MGNIAVNQLIFADMCVFGPCIGGLKRLLIIYSGSNFRSVHNRKKAEKTCRIICNDALTMNIYMKTGAGECLRS